MQTYIALARFTDQGLRTVRDTVKRADAAKELAGRFGVKMDELYWTLGEYDLVARCSAEDEAAITAFALALGSSGNVRFETLRALNRSEMAKVIAKLE